MAVLDCGCGPGSITLGLAEAVAPGDVLGIDVGASQLERARAAAAARGLTNVRFEEASAYEVPLPAGSVDVVFYHQVLQHLNDPAAALAEAHRVLRAGGLVAARETDVGSTVRAPDDDHLLERYAALYLRWWQRNGGNPYLGRQLRRVLRVAGFTRIQSSASPVLRAAPDDAPGYGEGVARAVTERAFGEQAVALGWTDRATLEAMAAAWRTWSQDPDAFDARIACEAVGWRD
jgi:SAM-dependent methyltransferase